MVTATDDADDTKGACEICGWMAAMCSALAFGTFAVPIKSNAARSVNIDPLVFQSYKTSLCFLTAWLILLVPGHHTFIFTPWGIVSGLFWVPSISHSFVTTLVVWTMNSGIATVYAVKTIGLALGVGIASSLIVLVSFIWGIFIFNEPIHSQFGASIAILCMILGLFGMSYYSTPTTSNVTFTSVVNTAEYEEVGTVIDDDDDDNDERVETVQSHLPYSDDKADGEHSAVHVTHRSTTNNHQRDDDVNNERIQISDDTLGIDRIRIPTNLENLPTHQQHHPQQQHPEIVLHDHELITHVHVCGQYKISKRYLGMASAAFCGLYGGSIMVPMKYSTANTKGTHFLLSFAIGSAIVNLALWIFRYIYFVFHYQSWTQAYHNLPSFHLRKMWLVGSTSGIIWSIGNFFSLISVFYLGEGVGYPLVQTSILISGLWGLFYFQEIQGTDRITKWLLSSVITVCGILLLSFEHHAK